jgi:hypothetical protein
MEGGEYDVNVGEGLREVMRGRGKASWRRQGGREEEIVIILRRFGTFRRQCRGMMRLKNPLKAKA